MNPPDLARRRMDARQPDTDAAPVMHQRWQNLLFLHWRFPAETIQRTLPAGLQVDTFEGSAWVGVVPFLMQRVRPRGLPPLPWLSWFLELNVRTYVLGPDGRPGVWFYSLDANQPLAVCLARRWFHLPYQHASMRASHRDGQTRYQCRRRHFDRAAHYHYRPLAESLASPPGSLEFFLVERYYLFAHDSRRDRWFRGQVHHEPYQLTAVDSPRWSTLPLEWNRLGSMDSGPDHACHAESLDVRIFAPHHIQP